MPVAKHIVQKLVAALHIADGADHKAIQDEIARICKEQVGHLLDEVLTQTAGNTPLYIPRLEIDLGKIAASRLEQDFVQKLTAALQQELEHIVPSNTLSLQNEANNLQKTDQQDLIKEQVASTLRETHTPAELVFHFLETGLFPWWAQETTLPYLAVQFEKILMGQKVDGRKLLTAVQADPAALQRMIYTFNDELLMEAASLMVEPSVVNKLLRQNEQLFIFFTDKLPAEQLRWCSWLAIWENIDSSQPTSRQAILDKTGEQFIQLAAENVNWTDLLQWLKQGNETQLSAAEKVALFVNGPSQTKTTGMAIPQKKVLPNRPVISAPQKPLADLGKLKTTSEKKLPNNRQPLTDVEKVYIQNAGLVLLWPFLNRFFQYLDIADEKAFVNETAAQRACLLLQYLVAGTTEDIFEAQLPLNKLLCGVPLLQPIPTQWEIQPEELAQTENLLQAIIINGGDVWKNLSVNGLRQAYLTREGILSSRDGAWLLQVERKPYDILLERLPWSVSIVRLPWMERLLFVEW